jgi:hypothetical protein
MMDSMVLGQSGLSVVNRDARSPEFPLSQAINPVDGGQTKDQFNFYHLDSPMAS